MQGMPSDIAQPLRQKTRPHVVDIKAQLARRKVRIHWIAGHVGIEDNERADALANLGVDESRGRL